MTRTLQNNEEFTLLTDHAEMYVKHGTGTTGTNFVKMPGNIPSNPEVEELISTDVQTLTLLDTTYQIDNNLNAYYKLVGARPKSRRR